MLSTTLSALKVANACQPRYRHLYGSLGGLKKYGKDTPVTYLQILELNGLEDCLWALAHGNDEALLLMRLWALDCAERVQHHSEAAQKCNAITRLFLSGKATPEELAAARAAAWAAWSAAGAAAWNASKDKQSAELRRVCLCIDSGTDPYPIKESA